MPSEWVEVFCRLEADAMVTGVPPPFDDMDEEEDDEDDVDDGVVVYICVTIWNVENKYYKNKNKNLYDSTNNKEFKIPEFYERKKNIYFFLSLYIFYY